MHLATMKRLLLLTFLAFSTLAHAEDAPKRPSKDAGPHEWANYENAVAAWNQRTAAAQRQAVADAARQRQIAIAAAQAELSRRLAAREERERQEADAAYRAWLRERQIQAMELQAQALARIAAGR
jgi:hypothetical protein